MTRKGTPCPEEQMFAGLGYLPVLCKFRKNCPWSPGLKYTARREINISCKKLCSSEFKGINKLYQAKISTQITNNKFLSKSKSVWISATGNPTSSIQIKNTRSVYAENYWTGSVWGEHSSFIISSMNKEIIDENSPQTTGRGTRSCKPTATIVPPTGWRQICIS